MFYRGRGRLLHFREDGAGMFADVMGAWGRVPVSTAEERRQLLAVVCAFAK